ncbi:hypothetical protein BGX21_007820 [Mortierella sp. AD011]|nr:hypothetical protein BGX20_007397 [Mortierella sp. AD010]KAF9398417.1 hypothetical protein BGX21_007820 [Mortierella sp. AD011]
MPSNATTRKAPLTDITHRTLTGRRSNNTSAQQVVSLTCSAGTGEENSPARGLLEIFAAAQAGSIGRKRSLKLTSDDCENHSPVPIISTSINLKAASVQGTALTTIASAIPTVSSKTTAPAIIPTKSKFSLSYNSRQHLNLISTLSRQQTFGRRNRPTYVANEARNLAVGDEDGTIHIVDTRRDNTHPEQTVQILAHHNAIFDLCWTRDDSKIISVSGDQSARLNDVETKTCLGTFTGHTGSIKSVSLKSGDDNIFATAARDGSILIWDVRCSSTTSPQGDTTYRPADRLLNVHASSTRTVPPKKTKHGSDGPNTASAVQYMKHNENIIASTGALDGSVKYWDVRKHGTYFKHDFPTPLQTSTYTPETKRAHGMTSMALSPDGSTLYAVSSDNHVYMFNAVSLGGPTARFGGSDFACSSYYIKMSVSPDGNYVAVGSCKDLYVWEVNRPDRKPLIFHGHEREVTAVDWAKDLGNGTQLSGCSDDATVRTWRANKELVEDCRENQSLQNIHGIVSE